ncbi:MAG: MerR family transcriptional regulator, partial [Actinomycetota bacterium]
MDTTFTIGYVARRSGIPVWQLRHYHQRGWLQPSCVDPATGRRRYGEDDLRRARLAGALRQTGMPAAEAVAAAVADDRLAVLAHLDAVAAASATIRQLMPPERPGLVRRLRVPSEYPAARRADPGGDPVTELAVLQTRVAAARGVAVADLPRATGRPAPLAAGPSVSFHSEGATAYLELPWDDAPLPEGLTARWVP